MNQLDGAMHVMEGVVRDLENVAQDFETESAAHLLLALAEKLRANKPMSQETGARFHALIGKLRKASEDEIA